MRQITMKHEKKPNTNNAIKHKQHEIKFHDREGNIRINMLSL